ncbi:uncharacterized protein EV154DRAFT_488997 [Mucor mucedo]|uniref:uncharacterized protein n=1 Tax=Mucor mucedo TaxID=29922 RepID=UPI00221FA7BE|nr:uncharacterized protein EV154DRAFT_488997 [Mucor mucedo]KAI7863923.1 hypothetical protein EV154DRAFT_488997 [Mucor mucedo]
MVEVASQNGTGNNQVAVQVYDRDSKSLKALFGRFKNAKSPTGTPSRGPLSVKAREIEELIKLKTAEAELGGIDDEFEDGDVEAETVVTAVGGGNNFPTIEEQAVENAAADDQHASSPRSVSRTTPILRKTRAAQASNLQDFTDTFAHYMSAAIKTMEGPSSEDSPGAGGNDVYGSRLTSLESSLELMSSQVNDMRGLLGQILAKAGYYSQMGFVVTSKAVIFRFSHEAYKGSSAPKTDGLSYQQYLTTVIVPEIACWIIAEDQGVKYEDAILIMKQTHKVGEPYILLTSKPIFWKTKNQNNLNYIL